MLVGILSDTPSIRRLAVSLRCKHAVQQPCPSPRRFQILEPRASIPRGEPMTAREQIGVWTTVLVRSWWMNNYQEGRKMLKPRLGLIAKSGPCRRVYVIKCHVQLETSTRWGYLHVFPSIPVRLLPLCPKRSINLSINLFRI